MLNKSIARRRGACSGLQIGKELRCAWSLVGGDGVAAQPSHCLKALIITYVEGKIMGALFRPELRVASPDRKMPKG
jgi:hypothetical protein